MSSAGMVFWGRFSWSTLESNNSRLDTYREHWREVWQRLSYSHFVSLLDQRRYRSRFVSWCWFQVPMWTMTRWKHNKSGLLTGMNYFRSRLTDCRRLNSSHLTWHHQHAINASQRTIQNTFPPNEPSSSIAPTVTIDTCETQNGFYSSQSIDEYMPHL